MDMEIHHDEQARRYTVTSGGQEVGLLTYRVLGDGLVDFTHTYVPPEHRGRGIAEKLVEHALEETLQRGLRFHASCWYVDAYARRYPRFQEALA
ncbi:MAG: GNAT family N-acetyltransferase [Thermoanaerobaculia bacterium]